MKTAKSLVAAFGLAAACSIAISAPAQDGPILPGGNWAGMVERTEGGHLFGNPDAETKIIEFMSYTCSHCATFAKTGEGAIKIAYVPTGKVSFEVRHLVRDPVDLTAVMLAQCGETSKFAGNHEAFTYRYDEWIEKARKATQAQQSRWQFGSLSARLQAIASDLDFYEIMETRGYTRTTVDRCLTDEAKAKEIADQSRADATQYGISGTPSFVIDGEMVDAHHWEALEPLIQASMKSQ